MIRESQRYAEKVRNYYLKHPSEADAEIHIEMTKAAGQWSTAAADVGDEIALAKRTLQ
jgi:hypothetical protein